MSSPESRLPPDDWSSRLAECDEAIQHGADPDDIVSDSPELEQEVAYLQLLREVLHRPDPSRSTHDALDTPTPTGEPTGPELPWDRLGRFEIRGELGRGGFGIVLLAYDPVAGREVALKIPRPEVLAQGAWYPRFQREAQAASALDHPNVVPLYELSQVGPVLLLVSAFCPGVTLHQWLQDRTDPVPFSTAAQLFCILADAIHHAHERGVVHRDLKPSNVLLTPGEDRACSEGEAIQSHRFQDGSTVLIPRITDFGLAHMDLETAEQQTRLTQTGALLGTAPYLSPEQAGGGGEVGRGCDVHALGVMLYEVLTGQLPYHGATDLDTIQLVCQKDPVSPSRLRYNTPRDLETICLKCLEKDPQKRYATAQAMAEDLRRFQQGKAIVARPVGPWEQARKWASRRPAVASMLGIIVLLTILGFGLVTWQWQRAEANANQEQLARQDETKQRLKAEEESRRKEKALYISRIARAQLSWRVNLIVDAIRSLEACPKELRHWEWYYLRRKCEGSRSTLNYVHPNFAVSHDRKLIATNHFDGSIRFRRIQDWKETGKITGGGHSAQSLFFRQKDTRFCLRGNNGSAIWDLTSRKRILSTNERLTFGRRYACSQIPIARGKGASPPISGFRVWDIGLGKQVGQFSLKAPSTYVKHLHDPQRDRLIVCNPTRGELTVYDVPSGKAVLSLPLQTRRGTYRLSINAQGTMVAGMSDKNLLEMWDLEKKERCLSHRASIPTFNVHFSPCGRYCALNNFLSELQVWDIKAWKLLYKIGNPGRARFSSDGELLGLTGPRMSIEAPLPPRVIRSSTGHTVQELRGHRGIVQSMAFVEGNESLISADPQSLKIWKLGADPVVREWQTKRVHSAICMTPDGQALVGAGGDYVLRVWDPQGAELYRAAYPKGARPGFETVAIHPDGKTVAAATHNGNVHLMDIQAGREVGLLTLKRNPVNDMAFHPNGKLLGIATFKGLYLFNLEKRELKCLLKTEVSHGMRQVLFTPNGNGIVPLSYHRDEKSLRILDLESGKQKGVMGQSPHSIRRAAWSSNGRRLAIASSDNVVRIWDAKGALLQELRHRARITNVVFSPDGKRLFTTAGASTVLWDMESGEEVLLIPTGPVLSGRLIFSPDQSRLIVSQRLQIRIWEGIWKDPSSLKLKHVIMRAKVNGSRDSDHKRD